MKLNIGVLGATGRMGTEILSEISRHTTLRVVGRWDRSTPESDLLQESKHCDVVIDFSNPEALMKFIALNRSTPIVSGTTGLNKNQERRFNSRAKMVRTLYSPNFSIAVFWMSEALKLMQPEWANLGFAAALTETHHLQKKDRPSGTALRLADAAGFPAPRIVSKREGRVVGDHVFQLESHYETLTISHHAKQRAVFAVGAVNAAKWLVQTRKRLPKRLLTMSDFLKKS